MMAFWDGRQSITEVIPHLFQGAAPQTGSDFSGYGHDAAVYVMCPLDHQYRGAHVVYCPIDDNAHEPAQDPPKLVGTSVEVMRAHASVVAMRVREGHPTVVLCMWGYNRSGLLVGMAMAQLGYEGPAILALQKNSRGPHPCGFGDPLNNPNFRALVLREASGQR